MSIIIPTLNEERYLPNLLASIRRQRFTEYEVIVSDGSSEDRTREIAEEFGCQVVVKPTRSPGYQRNRGAEVAHGKILLFLDADTVLPDEQFLSKALDEFTRRGLGVAGCYIRPLEHNIRYQAFIDLWLKVVRRIYPRANGCSIFVKKSLHDASGGFVEALIMGEDRDYVKQLSCLGRFGLLQSVQIAVSMRRFEKDGFWRVLMLMNFAELIRSLGAHLPCDRFGYKFGHYDKP